MKHYCSHILFVATATVLAAAVLTGCALFVVGDGKKEVRIEHSQRSPQGVVHLFKDALDSGNVQAATDLMVHPSGRRLLAVERYEIRDDVERWRRLMADKPITKTRSATLSATSNHVDVTLDYIRQFVFTTVRLEDSSWYVASINARQ